MFVHSLRESNFESYVRSIAHILPWFFALNHHHYARWLSVHLRDMKMLETLHPDVAKEFYSGKFTVNKTKRPCSAISLDQAHEQLNALVKGVGGAVGLTENPQALLRWMVAGPEISRAVTEFEQATNHAPESSVFRHHEQTKPKQLAFVNHVSSMIAALEEMGNPFIDDGTEIYAIDTHRVCDSGVVESVRTVEALGKSQCSSFNEDRLVRCAVSVTAPIVRNKLCLFKQSYAKAKPAHKDKLAAARNDCNLFSRLYIACQTRSGDLDTFFAHENQPNPPSLSSNGTLRFGTKSDLLACLEKMEPSERQSPPVDVLVLDGAAIIQMLAPGQCKTFDDYAAKVVIPYITCQLRNVSRLDLVWDQYDSSSLKAATRAKRGCGTRRKVMPSAELPRNWADFLRHDDNKTELFKFLSDRIIRNGVPDNKQLVITDQTHCQSSHVDVNNMLDPCSHEEADTRMILHVAHAVANSYNHIMIRTVDTDVVVLAVAVFQQLSIPELWIAFGVGRNVRYIAVHKLVAALGSDRSYALPFFHAFTGCDTVSCFAGHGKRTAWDTWNAFPDVTSTFIELCSGPGNFDVVPSPLQRFVVLMYERSSSKTTVNALRKHLFTKKSRSMEGLPPTEGALLQHTKRAVYQSGFCWHQLLQPKQNLPSPREWGWEKIDEESDWTPLWTTLPDVAKCCPELLKCGCKKGCSNRCKCMKAKTKCTALCACDGACCDENEASQ